MSQGKGFKNWLVLTLERILNRERDVLDIPRCDFERFCFDIRPCDVILVEGRTRVSDVIKTITLSRWTHSALYIGRVHEIHDEDVRNMVKSYYPGNHDEQLIIESQLGDGTIVKPLKKYSYDNLRICRPKDISPQDVQHVIGHVVRRLGSHYDVRQMLDLARFMLPYGILPRRWRSSLFEYRAGNLTESICSTMIAEAFISAHFPILPVIQRSGDGTLKWYRRNSLLFTPSDFDYSPYFDIIKHPFLGDDMSIYKRLPWDDSGVICNDETECFLNEEASGKER